MKGVILSLRPEITLVDITHQIPPGDIVAGAFALAASFQSFPSGTVHVAVVDPGVGGQRSIIAAETENCILLGPDNGILSLALALDRPRRICQIENNRYFRKNVSRTFHGRDIFGPVAAHLSAGLAMTALGRELAGYQPLNFPLPREESDQLVGAVQYVDRFGNAITNLPEAWPVWRGIRQLELRMGQRELVLPVCESYDAVAQGEALAIFGSTGFLEVAIRGGSAAETLGLQRGDLVVAQRPPGTK